MLLSTYKESWVVDFNKIKMHLMAANQGLDIWIEHIGSTSVPGLMAKPIIDIDIVYLAPSHFVRIKRNLESIGYYHVGDQGIARREVFKRTEMASKHNVLDTITHHLYVCHESNPELKRHLHFRDILRNNIQLKLEYQELKLKIAEMACQDKKAYAKLKESLSMDFFSSVFQMINEKR